LSIVQILLKIEIILLMVFLNLNTSAIIIVKYLDRWIYMVFDNI